MAPIQTPETEFLYSVEVVIVPAVSADCASLSRVFARKRYHEPVKSKLNGDFWPFLRADVRSVAGGLLSSPFIPEPQVMVSGDAVACIDSLSAESAGLERTNRRSWPLSILAVRCLPELPGGVD
jgi:hypothetical protein